MPWTWDDLCKSDFFSWFHVSELDRHAIGGSSATLVRCEPGSFQESIDLSFIVSADDVVQQSNLTFDRPWLAERRNAPLGLDLLKSWLLVLGAADAPLVELAAQFEALMASQPSVISRTGGAAGEAPSSSARLMLAVYRGQLAESRVEGARGAVALRNLVNVRPALQAVWLLNGVPEVSAPIAGD